MEARNWRLEGIRGRTLILIKVIRNHSKQLGQNNFIPTQNLLKTFKS